MLRVCSRRSASRALEDALLWRAGDGPEGLDAAVPAARSIARCFGLDLDSVRARERAAREGPCEVITAASTGCTLEPTESGLCRA